MDENVKSNETKEESGSEFKNDNVAVTVEKKPGCRVKLNVTVFPKAAQAAYKKAVKTVNKDVSLPGFRKGKAPEAMIIQNYGKYVDQEWQEIIVQTGFSEALTLTKLYPLSEELIKKPQIKKIAKDEDVNIIFEFESVPQVPEINPKMLNIKHVNRKEVTQDEIENSIKNIRLHHATWEDITDRAVQEGDYIDVDIEDLDNPGRYLCKDTRFEVAEGKMGDWMRLLVIGKKARDTVEGMSERSPDLEPEKEFKPTRCKITIKAIKTALLPEVDRELAQKVGVNTVDELNDRMTRSLNSQADEEVKHKLREHLQETLLERYPFDIPASLVQREMKNRLEYAKRELEKSGKSEEELSKRLEEVREGLEKQIHRAFHMFFIARKIADENNIGVTQEELVQELMLQMYSPSSPIDTSLDTEEIRNKVYISLLSQKVKDFLLDHVTIE